MYISAESPVRSVRPVAGGQVIIGGEGHKTGQDPDTPARYRSLEAWAAERFGMDDVTHRWSAQDYVSADGMPYVGLLTPKSHGVWVATGYAKWGMTNGAAAARIVADRIVGLANPWAEAFDSTRHEVIASARAFVTENLNVAKRFVGDRVGRPATSADDLGLGEGGIVEVDGQRS